MINRFDKMLISSLGLNNIEKKEGKEKVMSYLSDVNRQLSSSSVHPYIRNRQNNTNGHNFTS
jgi:hypothetical protein